MGDAGTSCAGRDGRRLCITVAVSTMNRPVELRRCVDAILAGSQLPAELLIVDQSSDDRTAEMIAGAGWGQRVALRHVRCTPRGLAASRNAATEHASRPIIAFTDDDCVPDAGWLAAIATAFGGPDRPDVVTGRVLALEGHGGAHAVSTRTQVAAQCFQGRTIPWDVGTGGNGAFRRAWLERVGGFDERLGAGSPGQSAEDMDLLYRVLRAGARACYAPGAVVFHARTDRQGMRARAHAYGFGMGAFWALLAAAGDPYALCIAARWLADRAMMLAATTCRGQWWRAADEIRAVLAAVRGVAYGVAASGVRAATAVNPGIPASASTLVARRGVD
jgi:GT2 family glycosyltransferase